MSGPALSFVVAVAENGVIGAGGALPWRIRSDLRRFRQITMGKPLIMGRKTFESIGRPLDGRDNIVVTRRPDFTRDGVIVAHDLERALSIAAKNAQSRSAGETCVIGGGEIFEALLPRAAMLHVTHVAAAPEGDVFFPEIKKSEWRELTREVLPTGEGDSAPATYALYERLT